jgi:hypothetical protein
MIWTVAAVLLSRPPLFDGSRIPASSSEALLRRSNPYPRREGGLFMADGDTGIAGIQAIKAERNHSLLRSNERIFLMTEPSRIMSFHCECGSSACTETIRPTLAEYKRVRGSSTSFMIAVGHDLPEFENVIEVCDRYEVVQRKGAGRI